MFQLPPAAHTSTRFLHSLFAALALLFTSTTARALDTVELVANVNDYANEGTSSFAVLNGKVILRYLDDTMGSELYIQNAPGEKPVLLKDINPGVDSSFPGEFFTAFGYVFFSAEGPDHGSELWITDGTAAGTKELADLNPGSSSSTPQGFAIFQAANKVAFEANTSSGRKFCLADASSASCTTLTVDFGNPRPAEFNGQLFVQGNEGVGYELYKVNVVGATMLVQDIHPTSSSRPQEFVTIPGKGIIFSADDGTNGREPWFTDGTLTYMLDDINSGASGSFPSDFAILPSSGDIIFAASSASTGHEVWKTDLTVNGATLVKDINPLAESSDARDFTPLGTQLLFQATDGTSGLELWKTDGTAGGTVLVKDVNPGADDSYPYSLQVFNNMLYFVAFNPDSGEELYVSNGSTAGTMLLADAFPGAASGYPQLLVPNGSELNFLAYGEKSQTLFVVDSTGKAVSNMTPLPGKGDNSSRPSNFFALDDTRIFYTISTSAHGEEPYIYDSSTSTFTLLKDIFPGDRSSSPSVFGMIGNNIIFVADGPGTGREIWMSDGTAAGTKILKDIAPGLADSSPNPVLFGGPNNINGEVYFTAATDNEGQELWKTDGTEAGTVLVKDIYPGPQGSQPQTFYFGLGQLFFTAIDPTNDRELWKTDGTEAGTVLVKDINPTGESRVGGLTEHDGLIFFRAKESNTTGSELFKTDGTTAGTVMVKDIRTGIFDSSPFGFTTLGSDLFFGAYQEGSSPIGALFKITAPYTAAEVSVVAVPDPTVTGSIPFGFTAFNGKLFFVAETAAEGIELWSSDGTTSGTALFKAFVAGPTDGNVGSLTPVGDALYFTANDGVVGRELWKTDGTPAGTMLAADINPGESNSNPLGLRVHRGVLYFAAQTAELGEEPYRVVFDECPDDSAKKEAGICGCGEVETDSDADGSLDCNDGCPVDPAKFQAGTCGCGVTDADSDGDATLDCQDSCPADSGKTTPGVCGCGVVDADSDGNGIVDCQYSQEFSNRVQSLIDAIGKLAKAGRSKKKKKASRLKKNAAQAALNELVNYFGLQGLNISSGNGTDLNALLATVQKDTKKAFKIKSKKFKKFKKTAAKSAGALRDAL